MLPLSFGSLTQLSARLVLLSGRLAPRYGKESLQQLQAHSLANVNSYRKGPLLSSNKSPRINYDLSDSSDTPAAGQTWIMYHHWS